MKLYYHPVSTTCRPIMLFAAESGIALDYELVDLFTGAHYKPDFPDRDDANFLKATIATYDAENDAPVISYDKVDAIRGMDIVFVTTAKTDKEAKALLKAFQLPFQN